MLKGKTAVVTGASRGIGRAIAIKLAENGADIAIIYAGNDKAAEDTRLEVQKTGRRAEVYKCDVSDFNASQDTINKILEDFGGANILVNNAGITDDRLLMQMSEESFDKVIGINLKGVFNITRHLSRHLIKKRSGRIINITSVIGIAGNAGQANYAASKAGIIGFTKSVARELAGRGITCNAVAPGLIMTDMTENINTEALIKNIPLSRAGSPEDVAHAVLFLAGPGSAYITGEVIRVDGGMCM